MNCHNPAEAIDEIMKGGVAARRAGERKRPPNKYSQDEWERLIRGDSGAFRDSVALVWLRLSHASCTVHGALYEVPRGNHPPPVVCAGGRSGRVSWTLPVFSQNFNTDGRRRVEQVALPVEIRHLKLALVDRLGGDRNGPGGSGSVASRSQPQLLQATEHSTPRLAWANRRCGRYVHTYIHGACIFWPNECAALPGTSDQHGPSRRDEQADGSADRLGWETEAVLHASPGSGSGSRSRPLVHCIAFASLGCLSAALFALSFFVSRRLVGWWWAPRYPADHTAPDHGQMGSETWSNGRIALC